MGWSWSAFEAKGQLACTERPVHLLPRRQRPVAHDGHSRRELFAPGRWPRRTLRRLAASWALLLMVAVLTACGPMARTSGDLNATVRMQDSIMSIANADKFDWKGVKVRLTSADGKGSYVAALGNLPAGQSRAVALYEFVNPTGYRWKYETMQASEVSITSSTPAGPGTWLGKLK